MVLEEKKHFLVVIAGPTAVGKTALSIRLAKHFNTEIISADARQFYRELEIGTAKPSAEELAEVKHHFINNKSITELYGAGDYEKDVMALLPDLFKKNNPLFLTGGSGLYINAVLNGVDDFDKVPSQVREELNEQYRRSGIEELQAELRLRDPEYFDSADQNNPQRLIRALEVIRHTGKTFSSFLSGKKHERDFVPVKILVDLERKQLYQQIESRVDRMMERGLLKEAVQLKHLRHLNALKTVGYNELYDHLDGLTDLATARELIKQHTRNYAKRQLTWFRNKDHFTAFGPQDDEEIIRYINKVMRHG